MKIFERITKRYALQNYYLRRNFYWPDTLPEILDYWQQHNDQQVTKQGKRPRNIRTLRKGQVSKIKI